MLTQLKENNRPLYLSLICGGGTLLALGTLRCLYVNRGKLCKTLGLCSNDDCCQPKSDCCVKNNCCQKPKEKEVTDNCKCDPCECDPCDC